MPYKTKEIPYDFRVGRDINSVSNLRNLITEQSQFFDFILIDVCHASNFRTETTIQTRDIALTRAGNCHFAFLFDALRKISCF